VRGCQAADGVPATRRAAVGTRRLAAP
jgi:hypothetical protein